MKKSIKLMTDAQVAEIAKLGMSEIVNFDFVCSIFQGQQNPEYEIKIVRENYDKDLMVIRVYLQGFGDNTYLHIWEGENDFDVDVDLVHDNCDHHLANTIRIVKKLIEWGFA